ncbi:MAG TPA: CPXCG motif-containing cysteine-rich protein [Polyangia bacterium]|jgi:hypothetical protein|nr:CPXCG motif-containing cysteine-rich protein [Polyangia bacterium]
MESTALCPYCGEVISLWVDEGGGLSQSYIEDCSVCCRPFEVAIAVDEFGDPQVDLRRLDD